MTKIFTLLAGQSCRAALNFWAAQQRRPAEDVKVLSCTLRNSIPTLNIELLRTHVRVHAH